MLEAGLFNPDEDPEDEVDVFEMNVGVLAVEEGEDVVVSELDTPVELDKRLELLDPVISNPRVELEMGLEPLESVVVELPPELELLEPVVAELETVYTIMKPPCVPDAGTTVVVTGLLRGTVPVH